MNGEVLNEFIELLKRLSEKYPVIVEGKRDYAVLRRFGIGNIYTLSGKNYFDLVESLPSQTEKVVLLTDIDRQGEKIFKKLSEILKKYNIEVVDEPRNYLKRLGIEEVEQISELLFKGEK